LISVTGTALRGFGDRSIVVVGNYKFWPDNGGYHAERKLTLYALVDPVSPPPETTLPSGLKWLLVEAPGTAPGSDGFITMAVYRHSRIAPAPTNIGIRQGNGKRAAKMVGETPFAVTVKPESR
jgi:hypothetical protein